MANPYRSREGLSARAAAAAGSDEVQVRIDPVHADLDEQILGLHSQVSLLKNVAQEIETEAKVQNDIISDLQKLMTDAESRMKNGMRRLKSALAQKRSNHVLQVILFGLACFTIIYLWTKHFRR